MIRFAVLIFGCLVLATLANLVAFEFVDKAICLPKGLIYQPHHGCVARFGH